MPKKTNPRNSVDELRHAEYYDMQPVFDDLYRRSKAREPFANLMEIILKRKISCWHTETLRLMMAVKHQQVMHR